MCVLKRNSPDPLEMVKWGVTNMVASTSMGFHVDLERLRAAHWAVCSYNPEDFSSLVFRLAQPDVTVLVFHTGKVVLTKGKTVEQVHEASAAMSTILAEFRVA